LAAAPVFGADVGAVLVWSKAVPQRLIGLFPLRIERRYGVLATLTGWTHPYAPFGVPLVDRDEADAAIGAFLDHVEAEPRLPKLVLLPLIAPALADYLMLEASGWKGRAGTAARQNAEMLHFVQSAIAALAAEGRVRIDRLTRGPTPLAAAITLRAGDCAWFWKIAYDEDAARASPGVQLSLDLTHNLLADASIGQTDSCATADHPMIDHLWRERLALTDLLIAPSRASLAQFHIARH